MLDGLLRLGLLTGNEEMTGFFKRNLDYLLAHRIGCRRELKKTQRMLSPLSFKITAPHFPAKKRIKRAA